MCDSDSIPNMEGEDKNPYFQGLITGQENLVAVIALEQLVAHRAGDQVSAPFAA